MAQFPGLALTVQGNQMILRSASGKASEQLKITKAVFGDGQLTGEITTMTNVISPKMEVTVDDEEIQNDTCIYHFVFDNQALEKGFFFREVGLYGKTGDNGEEKLIGYSNASGLTSYIQSKESPIPKQRLRIALTVGDNTNVKAVIDLSNAVTNEKLNRKISEHNADGNSHPLIRDQIKKILGSSNWNDNPSKNILAITNLLGEGGIVASKLTGDNGYVKWANGFTIQWIKSSLKVGETHVNIGLPIAINNCLASIANDVGTGAFSLGSSANNTTSDIYCQESARNSFIGFWYIVMAK